MLKVIKNVEKNTNNWSSKSSPQVKDYSFFNQNNKEYLIPLLNYQYTWPANLQAKCQNIAPEFHLTTFTDLNEILLIKEIFLKKRFFESDHDHDRNTGYNKEMLPIGTNTSWFFESKIGNSTFEKQILPTLKFATSIRYKASEKKLILGNLKNQILKINHPYPDLVNIFPENIVTELSNFQYYYDQVTA